MHPRVRSRLLTALILAIVVVIYWPLRNAGLVWDDLFYLHDRAWLREGDAWVRYAMHGFPDWGVYFRPLGVALFTFQVRALQTSPMAMHAVSLALHLMNVLLVGCIARALKPADASRRYPLVVYASMLVYGLHPALIEPVAWISSQYDLLATFFMLSGLFFNLRIRDTGKQVWFVSVSFFLAACSKESASAFPAVLFLFDWTRSADDVRTLIRRQRASYVGVICAGLAYLAVRRWGLGSLVGRPSFMPFFSIAHFQEICLTYVSYLKLIVWPMSGLGPMHPLPAQQLSELDPASIFSDLAALSLLLSSGYLLFKRHAFGAALGIATVALLPVLHIIPIGFDDTLYHERYAMFAIAVACVWVPAAAESFSQSALGTPLARQSLAALAGVWLVLAAVGIRITLPLWADELRLWRWALSQNPDSRLVQDALLATYLERGQPQLGAPYADRLMQTARDCSKCMLNVAYARLMQSDADGADQALNAADEAMRLTAPARNLVVGFVIARGNLEELRGHPDVAEEAYATAMQLDPLGPEPVMNLALLEAKNRQILRGEEYLQRALVLSAADQRERRRREFDRVVGKLSSP
jgi:hypothetical protein